jgi:2-amino-4-hydroxy-6-hydroxymethyldihydropteridine diphosphokinase
MPKNELAPTSGATVYLGLGSNLGDRLKNLERTIDLIGRRLKLLRRSPVYETVPVDVPSQGKFLNMVIEAQTSLPPHDLLKLLKGIEQMLGRGTAGSEAPRSIDIDILFYGDLKMMTEALTIPHPRLSRRAFVLVPLNDMAPCLEHPVTKKTVAEMLSGLGETGGVELYIPPSRDEGQNEGTAR